MRFAFAFILTLFSFLSPASADPGDLWEGTWRNSDSKTIWLFQDGNRVWGSTSHSYRYVASVSPDGRTIRGTYFQKSHKQGLFEFTLRADSQGYDSEYIKGGDPYPSALAEDSSYGYRADTTYTRTDYIDLAVSDGTQEFDASYNPNDPADVAWMSFQSPYDQPIAPTVDISDLEIPAPGNLGLWQVLDDGGQHVGTVAMDGAADGSFVAAGQIRLADYKDGIATLASFRNATTPLDELHLGTVDGIFNDVENIVILQGVGEEYNITFDDFFLGDSDYRMRLIWIEGSIPPPPAADLSGLTAPTPGNLGLMKVTLNGQEIGTVNWTQLPAQKITMEGQVVLPALSGGTPWDLKVFEGPALLDDKFSFREAAGGTLITGPVGIREREGDYYVMTVPPGTLSADQLNDYVFHFTHIQGSTPSANASDDPLLTDTYFVTALSEGTVAKIHGAANRSAPVIAYLDNMQTGITMLGCDPILLDEYRSLNGAELTDKLQGRYCEIRFDGVTGWVLGNYLTR